MLGNIWLYLCQHLYVLNYCTACYSWEGEDNEKWYYIWYNKNIACGSLLWSQRKCAIYWQAHDMPLINKCVLWINNAICILRVNQNI